MGWLSDEEGSPTPKVLLVELIGRERYEVFPQREHLQLSHPPQILIAITREFFAAIRPIEYPTNLSHWSTQRRRNAHAPGQFSQADERVGNCQRGGLESVTSG